MGKAARSGCHFSAANGFEPHETNEVEWLFIELLQEQNSRDGAEFHSQWERQLHGHLRRYLTQNEQSETQDNDSAQPYTSNRHVYTPKRNEISFYESPVQIRNIEFGNSQSHRRESK